MKLPALTRWLAALGADVVARALLQLLGTVLMARLLGPAAFGQAALVTVSVGVLCALINGLFEEALVQRHRARISHFRAALSGVLVLAVLMILTGWTVAMILLPTSADLASVVPLAATYGLVLLAEGPLSIVTALARRRRRFGAIATANTSGLLVGTLAGLGLATGGAGVWSLLAVPFLARWVSLAVLMQTCGAAIVPLRSLRPARDLLRFGSWHLGGRTVESLGDALVQSLVTRHFGFEGNGYLNMAQRVVEPLRGAAGSIGHNLSLSAFARLQHQPERLAGALITVVRETAVVMQPAFAGLAVCASVLILVLGGRGWEPSAPLAALLALAAAVASASSFVHGALSARGRADLGFAFSLAETGLTVALLWWMTPLGLVSVAVARLVAWSLDAAVVINVAGGEFGLRGGALVRALVAPVLCSLTMAAAVAGVDIALRDSSSLLRLMAMVGSGVAVYGLLSWQIQRSALIAVMGRLRGR